MAQLQKAGVDLTQRATVQAVVDQMDELVSQMEAEAAKDYEVRQILQEETEGTERVAQISLPLFPLLSPVRNPGSYFPNFAIRSSSFTSASDVTLRSAWAKS